MSGLFDFDTMATLEVKGLPPPTPFICKLSGEPKTESKKFSLLAISVGISSFRKYNPFDVPPLIHIAGVPSDIF